MLGDTSYSKQAHEYLLSLRNRRILEEMDLHPSLVTNLAGKQIASKNLPFLWVVKHKETHDERLLRLARAL
jgi:hypothetical protein